VRQFLLLSSHAMAPAVAWHNRDPAHGHPSGQARIPGTGWNIGNSLEAHRRRNRVRGQFRSSTAAAHRWCEGGHGSMAVRISGAWDGPRRSEKTR